MPTQEQTQTGTPKTLALIKNLKEMAKLYAAIYPRDADMFAAQAAKLEGAQ